MDSEGMVKACAINVTTKMAMATVPAIDCSVAGQSPVNIFSLQDIARP